MGEIAKDDSKRIYDQDYWENPLPPLFKEGDKVRIIGKRFRKNYGLVGTIRFVSRFWKFDPSYMVRIDKSGDWIETYEYNLEKA